MMRLPGLLLMLFGTLSWGEVPQSRHVWIVTEENHSYESVIGNSNMPYFNSLAAKYGLATQYYSEQHNSLSALMWLVAGQPITSNNQTTTCYNLDNITRHLIAQGYTWRSYQEDLPYPGFTGLNNLKYVPGIIRLLTSLILVRRVRQTTLCLFRSWQATLLITQLLTTPISHRTCSTTRMTVHYQ